MRLMGGFGFYFLVIKWNENPYAHLYFQQMQPVHHIWLLESIGKKMLFCFKAAYSKYKTGKKLGWSILPDPSDSPWPCTNRLWFSSINVKWHTRQIKFWRSVGVFYPNHHTHLALHQLVITHFYLLKYFAEEKLSVKIKWKLHSRVHWKHYHVKKL